MKNQDVPTPRRLGTIAWIMSRPEGKQLLASCLIVIMTLGWVVIRQEFRYENNIDKWQKREDNLQNQLRGCKQETIDLLKSYNEDAQRMKDSLYSNEIRLNRDR